MQCYQFAVDSTPPEGSVAEQFFVPRADGNATMDKLNTIDWSLNANN